MNGIVYSHIERWYKQDRVQVPVEIVDRDSLSVIDYRGTAPWWRDCLCWCHVRAKFK
ncbi:MULTISPECIES: hypothetical protein [Parabacteroides]|uniref:Uncharacterized protein n=1 Tax=Parabacteroides distasonis TaxID=823 RepID=A0AAP2Q9N7_PARDI|nr:MULTISPECIES: hypothetical protein [Parabacteroides]MBV4298962.1 hypothetical protein [Parabacteroides distasonis]MBV4306468.1 hypothetical protein [Parabacteroides distasonis]MBV4317523.1 hypothetical protein [Parabacteroides distasonis]MBV4322217.1 hypothetical protein [Parabacteroides distasonis]MBV4334378.1 hypothetical protein [Parabacteroides distasonis]